MSKNNGNKNYKKSVYGNAPRAGKSNQQRRAKSCPKDEESDYTKGPNDAYWYGATPAIVRDTASLTYGFPVGRGYVTGTTRNTQTYGKDTTFIPGVWAFYVNPAVGISTDASSPLNIAARNLYSYVRHANSGHSNYDAPDLMLYMMAMDSIYYMYAWGCELYGLARQYNHVNRYWPDAILRAMNVDVASWTADLANVRYYLDIVAKKVGSMCVPNVFSYFKRHSFLFEGVYTDAPVLKSQIYAFAPNSWWEYDEVSGAGKLTHVNMPVSPKFTFEAYKTAMNNMISKVIESEDLNIMSGDILKAFGANECVKLNLVPIEYETPIRYSPEVLSQIQNATITGIGAADVTQTEAGALIFDPAGIGEGILENKKLLTMSKEDVSPEETLVATRLTAFYKEDGTNVKLHSVGSEYIHHATIVYMDGNGTYTGFALSGTGVVLDLTNPTTTVARLNNLTVIEKFNQHPLVFITSDEDHGYDVVARLQDMDNFTLVDAEDIREMNEGALLSMFNVPQLGLWSDKGITK